MPLIETKGAASAQGFGLTLGSSGPVTYIEDVFSTWLYTGNGGTQTITNGINLSGNGGLVWIKDRTDANNHALVDTVRGGSSRLSSNLPDAADTNLYFSAFNTTGFSIGTNNATVNQSSDGYVSWTFREQPKFFDIVSYTGNGANRTIAHNLGSVPGCIMVKRINVGSNWQVYHRSLANTQYLVLNDTAAAATGTTRWNSTTPTSTEFSLGTDSTVNANGGSYIAYLFAHNAGGFGLTGTDNVISCGSYSGSGAAGNAQNLGYEPQWVLIKASNGIDDWHLFDNMRGIATGGNDAILYPNLSSAEYTAGNRIALTATGFTFEGSNLNFSGTTYIYIAIRRGPMKVPTSGASVFSPIVISGATGNGTGTTNFPVDLSINSQTTGSTYKAVFDRMRKFRTNNGGTSQFLYTNDTSAETTSTTSYGLSLDSNTSFTSVALWNGSTSAIYWNFRRAPGFFDVVCYTGTGSATTVTHNLGVAPEMMIIKTRQSGNWEVYHASLGNTSAIELDQPDGSFSAAAMWNSTTPTATVFSLGTLPGVNANAATYVAYLFATCAGVSKVGSYTGTGALQTINCGFTGGARFVLIKRTDSTGDWYVYDSARGISSGNDPYLFLNTPDAEVTGTNYVDTTSVGFQVTAAAPAGLNANGGTYIFLAIA